MDLWLGFATYIDCWPISVARDGDRQWSMPLEKGRRLQNAAQSKWNLWLGFCYLILTAGLFSVARDR
jgi:hypothetical protein